MESQFSQVSQIPGTQLSQNVTITKFEYDQLVLFNWAPGLRSPFKNYRQELFNSSEIRKEYNLCQIPTTSRVKKLKNLKCFPGESLSLFAKMEKGNFSA